MEIIKKGQQKLQHMFYPKNTEPSGKTQQSKTRNQQSSQTI